jgi:methyl-accepting chemotaxis protein
MNGARLGIGARLVVLTAIFLLGFAFYGGWSFKTLNDLKVNGPIYQRIVQSKDLIADVLPPPEYIIESYLVTLLIAATADTAQRNELIDRLKRLKSEYDTRHDFWSKEALEPELKEALLERAHEPATKFYAIAFGDFVPAAQTGDKQAAAAAMVQIARAYDAHRQAVNTVVELSAKRGATDEALAKRSIESASLLLLAILLLSATAGIAMAVLITRGITRPLRQAVLAAKALAGGDLSVKLEVRSTDETGQVVRALQMMVAKLSQVVRDVNGGAEALAGAAEQVSATALALSHASSEQAAGVERTSASIEQMTASIAQNTDNAKLTDSIATKAATEAVAGNQAVNATTEAMKQIARKTSIIDDIAYQTNLLALNAAIEAARAGEHGRGFAVVAAEVRKLAERSQLAAQEIEQLADSSVRLADDASRLLREMVPSIEKTSHLVQAITTASEEQSSEVSQISSAVSQMTETTQQNAASSEQLAATAEHMSERAEQLQQTMGFFKLGAAFQLGTPHKNTTTGARHAHLSAEHRRVVPI